MRSRSCWRPTGTSSSCGSAPRGARRRSRRRARDTTRRQRLVAWAGEIPTGPRARRPRSCTWLRWRGRSARPGGRRRRLRRTHAAGARAALERTGIRGRAGARRRREQEALGARCDAIVLSEEERDALRGADRAGPRGRAPSSRSRPGAAGERCCSPDGRELAIGGPRVSDPTDDLGAGDVFAAAMFVELHGGAPPARAAAFAAAAAAVRLDGRGPGGDRRPGGDQRRLEAAAGERACRLALAAARGGARRRQRSLELLEIDLLGATGHARGEQHAAGRRGRGDADDPGARARPSSPRGTAAR